LDVYKQYKILANFLESIPDYIHVFIIPGNHDAVQRAEPQPELPYALMESKQSNVHLLPNPSWIVTHGISTLAYHGTSMDSMIDAIPNLSYSRPEEVMTELLKRRHLSPIYGGNVIVPSRNDSLVINNVPDILNMGHVHKTGIAEYHGVHIINSGSWQDRTSFQVKHGLIPEPCVLPVFEAKSYALTSVDFRNL
jgi:DNA polymerase II small subunit